MTAVVDRFERFACDEAPGRSAMYEAWARRVVDDPAVATALASIAPARRQPPLVFAVVRLLGAPKDDLDAWASWVVAHAEAIADECGRRSVQTNEPLRCAALLPVLSLIEGPVALLEVGASAGLCLYPDRYSYRYHRGAQTLALDPPNGVSPVVLHSDLEGTPELRMPEVVWRAGIDLHPLDARRPEDRAWLTGLVWPGEEGRRERIDAALDIAASAPPVLVAGDGADALPALAAEAPRDATLVVTTPGVLAHVPRTRRAAVIAAARAAGRWITLDSPGLHDGWTRRVDSVRGGFSLALDGDVVAEADPLGAWVAWHPGSGPARR